MDAFALRLAGERAELFNEAAAKRGVAALIIEKDFWVCWTLKRLFALQGAPGMIFKGGTSLSKAYGLIERFSEDIDISIDRAALGFAGERDPAREDLSATKRRALLDAVYQAASAHVADALLPRLKESFGAALGDQSWSIGVDRADPQTLNFIYPPSLQGGDYAGFAYVRPMVRLEFGARADHWPAEAREIRPYAALEFPDVIVDALCAATTLAAERTLWEKATILHAEFHRPQEKAFAERLSRHYYDVAMLSKSPVKETALAKPELLAAVARHKALFFSAAWAKYEDAKPGSLRLAPHGALEKSLRADYAKMAEMIFGEPPAFDSVIAELAALEKAINDLV